MFLNGELVKNVDLNLKIVLHKYLICFQEYISSIVYTNGENHLFSSLLITCVKAISQMKRVFESRFGKRFEKSFSLISKSLLESNFQKKKVTFASYSRK